MRLAAIEPGGETTAPLHGAADVVVQIIEATVALYQRRGFVPPWIGYLAMQGDEIVGSCGFAGPPSEGEVEIAYFTFPGNEGKGIAKAMARELMRTTNPAATQLGAQFIAHTLPESGPSTSILKSLGFILEGEIHHPEDGLVWKWRRGSSVSPHLYR